jgi:hypothetical protein
VDNLQGNSTTTLVYGLDQPGKAGNHVIVMNTILTVNSLAMCRNKGVAADNEADTALPQPPVDFYGRIGNLTRIIGGGIPGSRPDESVPQLQITDSTRLKQGSGHY